LGFAVCPRPRNAAATRAAILEAATGRFAAESYEQVGMRDIARDVGVDPALISRYFGSKEELFRAVLDDCDGKEFTDFRLGYGPIILGYCDERVDRAVCDEVRTS
jgi:AcrR family transcriptional regulator